MDSKEYSGASGTRVLDVGVGDYRVADDGYSVLETGDVFTCVAVGLYDKATGSRGLVHARTPGEDVDGVNRLLGEMAEELPPGESWQAYVVGGGYDPDCPRLGMSNGNSAKSWLEEFGVEDVELETGGELKRDVRLLPSGEVEIDETGMSQFNRRNTGNGRRSRI